MGRRQVEGRVLPVEALLAEVVEVHLAGEVLPDEGLHPFVHLRLEDVLVYPGEFLHLICGVSICRYNYVVLDSKRYLGNHNVKLVKL